jgi:hypothetical protein
MNDTLPPLPEPQMVTDGGYFLAFGNLREGAFSADQLRAYAAQAVAQERERCAKIAEDCASKNEGTSARLLHPLLWVAKQIRRGQQKENQNG